MPIGCQLLVQSPVVGGRRRREEGDVNQPGVLMRLTVGWLWLEIPTPGAGITGWGGIKPTGDRRGSVTLLTLLGLIRSSIVECRLINIVSNKQNA